MDNFLRYLKEIVILSKSHLFDAEYYYKSYPDVRRADINPLFHYVKYGWKEGRNPSKFFNTLFYLDNYPDVRYSGANPLVHYVRFGQKESRIIQPIHFSTSHDPKVSIVIPTYNGSKTIQKTLESVLSQSYSNFEIIIVDDDSSDSTIEIVKQIVPTAHIIHNNHKGTMSTRQLGIDAASGDFIALLDQDDIWYENLLTEEVKILIDNPEIGLVFSNMKAIDENGNLLSFNVIPDTENYVISWEKVLLIGPIALSTVVFRKKIINLIGGLDVSFGHSGALGDSDFFIRSIEVTKVHFIPKNLGFYRWSETRPGRLVSFLDNLEVYAKKYWHHPRLQEKNNNELRSQFVQACGNYGLHIYRLLLKQYGNKVPNHLIYKLNQHHHNMTDLFGELYKVHIGLRAINLELIKIEQDYQKTLVYIYLLRRDLQEKFPELMQGEINEILNWSRAVADNKILDSDSSILEASFRSHYSQISLTIDKRLACLKYLIKDSIQNNSSGKFGELIKFIKSKIHLKFDPRNEINFPIFKNPTTAIVVFINGNRQQIYSFMNVLEKTLDEPCSITIIVRPSFKRYLKKYRNINIALTNKNVKDSIEMYNLVRELLTSETYILFLSDDIEVAPSFMKPMISILESDHKHGVVAGKVISKSGKEIIHAGGITIPGAEPFIRGLGEDPDKPEYSYVRTVDTAHSNFHMVRREILERLSSSKYQNLSSLQYFRKIKEFEYKIVYQPKAVASLSTRKSTETLLSQNINSLTLDSKPTILRNIDKKAQILILDDYIPAIRYGSGFPRLYEMLICLANLGYAVTFFPVGNPIKIQPETDVLQQKGIEVFYESYSNLSKFLQDRKNFYDIVIISRPHVFQNFVYQVKAHFPNAVLIYDAEALFYTRNIMKAKLKGEINIDEIALKERRKELELISIADLVISVSEIERDLMAKNSTQPNIEVWGHVQKTHHSNVSYNEREGILFVGSFFAGSGSPNEDAAVYFVREIFPEIKNQLKCKLFIVGSDPTQTIKELSSPDIEVTGFVEDLGTYFNTCRINVIPTRFAAGIPLKLLDAMSYGVPTVTTKIIAQQLDLKNNFHLLVAEDKNDFINKVIHLYSNEDLWNKLRINSYDYIEKEYSTEKMKASLSKIMNKAFYLKR